MHGVFRGLLLALLAASLAPATPLLAQQSPDNFHWIDFHAKPDQDTVVWVTRSLDPEKWSAIREIGVEYDAALVVTTLRKTPANSSGLGFVLHLDCIAYESQHNFAPHGHESASA